MGRLPSPRLPEGRAPWRGGLAARRRTYSRQPRPAHLSRRKRVPQRPSLRAGEPWSFAYYNAAAVRSGHAILGAAPVGIVHTNKDAFHGVPYTSRQGVSNRKLSRMRVATGEGRVDRSFEADGSLAARELSFLVRLAQAAASTQKPDELLDLIIEEATSAMGKDVMRVGEGITGWVAESRRPAVVPDVSKEPHWKWVPGLDEDRFLSMLSVPIESGPRMVGVLNVQTVAKRVFDSADIDFL